MRQRRASGDKSRARSAGETRFPLGLGQFLEFFPVKSTGVVDERVETAKAGNDFLHETLPIGKIGEGTGKTGGASTSLDDLFHRRFGLLTGSPVMDRNAMPLFRQPPGQRRAQSTG